MGLGSFLPEDIEEERQKVLEFSKGLSKQINSKFNSFEELKEAKLASNKF